MVCTMLRQLIRKFKGKGFSSKIQIQIIPDQFILLT